ncbi:sugar-binding protein [Mariniflexile ostreae]|uniref:Sugar-binding protein n=1 Tax=Mariniflexile ostreae TaxID=1520892 RepID=A0ABV5FFM1_9FLAO
MNSKLKKYRVKKIDENHLKINGKADHPLWEKATGLTDFCSPWDDENIKEIEFKALWDGTYVFFCFKVQDSDIHIDTADNTVKSINNSDRVELFFRSNKQLDPYYCLEIDPSPRLMDFKAKPNRVFDFNWKWPEADISIKSDIQNDFFTVEIAISVASLIKKNLLKEGTIETGIYRAKYNKQENGNYEPTWITWVDPNTETPDFHTSTSFGLLQLEEVKL